MATRKQTGGIARDRPQVGARPMYEDFRPISEWKQEEQSDVLLVYLPGFVKEQLKVSIEGTNTLRVRGERVVGGNKWSRFEEQFRTPEDCNSRGIRAKFQAGTLTITMPKKSNVAHVNPKEEAKTTHEAPQPQEDTRTKADLAGDATRRADGKSVQSPRPREGLNLTKHRTGREDDVSPKITSANREGKKTDGKGLEEPKMLGIALGKVTKEREESERTGSAHEESDGGVKLDKYKQAMKGLVSMKEERETFVYIGTAILVMVLLGAYISYSLVSSGNAEN